MHQTAPRKAKWYPISNLNSQDSAEEAVIELDVVYTEQQSGERCQFTIVVKSNGALSPNYKGVCEKIIESVESLYEVEPNELQLIEIDENAEIANKETYVRNDQDLHDVIEAAKNEGRKVLSIQVTTVRNETI